MVVSFTPNIGLAKPSEAELAANWARFDKLIEDNNTQIIDKVDINIQTYTPAVIAHTANPNLGTGVAKGEFMDIQGFVMGNFIIPFLDAGISVGSGEYGIELPFELDSSFHTVGSALNGSIGQCSVIGHGYVYDNTTVNASGSVALDAVTLSPGSGVSYARLIPEVFPGKTVRVMNHSQPFPPENLDCLSGFFNYKKA